VTTTDTRKVIYAALGRSKYEWLRIARNLYTAAEILYETSGLAAIQVNEILEKAGSIADDEFPEAQTHIIARMLAGMSMENLIKGLILRKTPDKISEEKIDITITVHYLQDLIKQLPEFKTSKKEMSILDTLTKAVIWMGRYPLPTKSVNFHKVPLVKNEKIIVAALYTRLKTELENV
jgi:hypothetical protein